MEELLNVARFLFLAELCANHLADRKVCDKDAGMLGWFPANGSGKPEVPQGKVDRVGGLVASKLRELGLVSGDDHRSHARPRWKSVLSQ